MRLVPILFAIMAACCLQAGAARAQSDPYTVTGVKVDATAANAVDARTKAFGQAQQAAFIQLAQHFLTPDQMKSFQPPAPDQITPLVNDFEVTNEQLSSVRYVGTYTFRFRPGASRALIMAKAPAAAAAVAQAEPTGPVASPAPAPRVGPASAATTPAGNTGNGAWQGERTGSTTALRVHYASLPEWIAAQRMLRRAGGGDLRITSVSPTMATVAVAAAGGADALRPQLLQAGYTLALSENNGAYDVTPAMATPSRAAP